MFNPSNVAFFDDDGVIRHFEVGLSSRNVFFTNTIFQNLKYL